MVGEITVYFNDETFLSIQNFDRRAERSERLGRHLERRGVLVRDVGDLRRLIGQKREAEFFCRFTHSFVEAQDLERRDRSAGS